MVQFYIRFLKNSYVLKQCLLEKKYHTKHIGIALIKIKMGTILENGDGRQIFSNVVLQTKN